MLDTIFRGLFDSSLESTITLPSFLLCLGVSLVIGLLLAVVYKRKSHSSQSFVTTLALLPAVVCMVILLVNGNVGAGVAVAGTFSLVRFRSAPGTAKEIAAIFIAMAAGLATGMGYLAFAALFTLILCGAEALYGANAMKKLCSCQEEKLLRITIPEDLDYTGVFDEIFHKYLDSHQLMEVKTTNMGSLFRLTYQVQVKKEGMEKYLMDEVRCRNGNLEVSFSRVLASAYEL